MVVEDVLGPANVPVLWLLALGDRQYAAPEELDDAVSRTRALTICGAIVVQSLSLACVVLRSRHSGGGDHHTVALVSFGQAVEVYCGVWDGNS